VILAPTPAETPTPSATPKLLFSDASAAYNFFSALTGGECSMKKSEILEEYKLNTKSHAFVNEAVIKIEGYGNEAYLSGAFHDYVNTYCS